MQLDEKLIRVHCFMRIHCFIFQINSFQYRFQLNVIAKKQSGSWCHFHNYLSLSQNMAMILTLFPLFSVRHGFLSCKIVLFVCEKIILSVSFSWPAKQVLCVMILVAAYLRGETTQGGNPYCVFFLAE